MKLLREVIVSGRSSALRVSPGVRRVAPFFLFLVLTSSQGGLGEASRYWVYALKTVVGVGLVMWMWPGVREMRWQWSWGALGVGVAVCIVWVGLDPYYPKWGPSSAPWDPHRAYGGVAATVLVGVRWVGSSLVVPPLEEVFYRSFLYRYVAGSAFDQQPLGVFAWWPFVATSVIFGFTHREWLAGILCGLAYQGLVCWKKRLGDAMMAHAITNALLGLWVVEHGAWHFW